MSKKAMRRALIGFAEGAARTLQSAYQTKIAQEAEMAKEQRLAALRAQERGEDRAFQRETMEMQNQQRTAERGEERAFQTSMREGDREFQRQQLELQQRQQLALADKSRETQLAVASTYRQPGGGESPSTRYLVDRGGNQVEVSGADLQPGDKPIAGITGSGGIVPLIGRGSGAAGGSSNGAPTQTAASARPGQAPAGSPAQSWIRDPKTGRLVPAPAQ